jgi:hypothetical protein
MIGDMRMIKHRASLFAFIFAFASLAGAYAQAEFTGLSAAERAALSKGDAVFRSLSGYKKLALPDSFPHAEQILEAMKKLGPNYLGETIMVIPKSKGGPDLLARLAALLEDTAGYKGIPYWSEANDRFYDLFAKSAQLSKVTSGDTTTIEASHYMEPFDEYRARYILRAAGGTVYYAGENLTPLVYEYRDIKVLDPGKMRWILSAYDAGDRYLLYGVGAAKAFDMMGLFRGKIETSLVGRIKAFFGFVFGKL